MRLDADGPHAGAATAMRDGKGLVQVQVADIAADLSGLHQPDQRVHVRPVDIDLPAVAVGDLADLADRILENAMRAGIGDHHRRQPVPGLRGLVAEILKVDITIRRRFHHHDLHPGHLGAGRVGAMGGHRDQADIAILTARAVIGCNRQQPRIFPLRAAVGLHGKRVIAGDRAQLVHQIADRLGIARRLIARRKGMQRAEFGPCQRHHLGRRVQLHRAGPQRDHRPVQRQIAIRQTPHIAHHLGFRPVHVKDRMGQVIAVAQQIVGNGGQGRGRRRLVDAKGVQQPRDHARIGGLINADPDAVATHLAQVDAALLGGSQNPGLPHAHPYGDGVEKRIRRHLGPGGTQRIGHRHCVQMDPLRNGAQTHRPVKHGIERCHHRQQRLRGTDIAGRLLAPDMLLAGLQRQPIGAVAAGIDGHADDPPGHGALQLILAGHEPGMRPAIAHRHPEPLRRTHGDIGPHRARLLQQAQRQQIGGDHGQRPGGMQRSDIAAQIADMAIGAGILENRAKDLRRIQILGGTDDDLDPQRRGAGLDHRDGLRMQATVHKERPGLRLRLPLRHGHRLGRRCRLVQQAGIGDGQAGQIADHGLEIQQGLQPALRDLGLIGRIGRVPCRIFQNVALDRWRRDGTVIALTDQTGHHPVLLRDLLHPGQQRGFGQRRPVQRLALPDRGGHGLLDQRIKAVRPHRLQHLGHLRRRGADMAAIRKIIGVIVGRAPTGHTRHPLSLAGQLQRRPSLVCKYPLGVRGAKRPRPPPGRKARQNAQPISAL